MMGPLRIAPWVPPAARRWRWRRVSAHMIAPPALPVLNAARSARGLAPVRLLGYMFAVPDLSIALFPEWFAATQPDWPRPLLSAGFPRYDPDPDASPDPALIATRKLGQRAIFLTPYQQQLPPDLPPSVLWQPYMPLRALLPQVAALVRHGGIGTTAEALRAGTPQLVVPLAHDQFDNAARVAAIGAGRVLTAARLTPSRLERSLGQRLSSTTAPARCRALAAQFADGEQFDALRAALAALVPSPAEHSC